MMQNDRARATLYGVAFGDAMGFPGEFQKSPKGLRKAAQSVSDRLSTGSGRRVSVSDDTQMTLALGEALYTAERVMFRPTADEYADTITYEFRRWAASPENTRAPGVTCMSSIRRLRKMPWQLATNLHSKGNGANMRVAPVAFMSLDTSDRAGLAQLQAAITHAHPAALASADLTQYAIHLLVNDCPLSALGGKLLDYTYVQENVWHKRWLGNLWNRNGTHASSAEEFISRGWIETRNSLIIAMLAADGHYGNPDRDPCKLLGMGGWTADEALALAVYVATTRHDPETALQYAAATDGDSDSIASIAGALIGAKHGMKAWSDTWVSNIEYTDRIKALGEWLDCDAMLQYSGPVGRI